MMTISRFVADWISPTGLMGSWNGFIAVLVAIWLILLVTIVYDGIFQLGILDTVRSIIRQFRKQGENQVTDKKRVLEMRSPWQIQLALFLIAIGIFVLATAQIGSRAPEPISVTCGSCGSSGGTNQGPYITHSPPGSSGLEWPIATVLCALSVTGVLAGVKLCLSGKDWKTRAVGATMSLGTLLAAGGFSAIKEFKIDKMLDVGDVEVRIDKRLNAAAPRYLGTIRCFRAGNSDIPMDTASSDSKCFPDKVVDTPEKQTLRADEWLRGLCPAKEDNATKEVSTMILVVGATDRTRLRGNLPRQYDSNVGLAQARAEKVASHLSGCNQVLALAAGPKYTDADISKPGDHWEDRKVDIWEIGYRQTAETGSESESWFTRIWRAISFHRKKEANNGTAKH